MFQIKTKKIELVKLEDRPENPFHTTNFYKKTKSVHDQLMNCRCWHSICGHRFVSEIGKAGKCDYPYCTCKEFVQGSVEIWDHSENYEEVNNRKYEGGLF